MLYQLLSSITILFTEPMEYLNIRLKWMGVEVCVAQPISTQLPLHRTSNSCSINFYTKKEPQSAALIRPPPELVNYIPNKRADSVPDCEV